MSEEKYCAYCKEQLSNAYIVENDICYHIICYLNMIGIYLDSIDEEIVRENYEK